MNRKQRRTLQKLAGKEATSSIDLMLDMGDKCFQCEKPYDKTSREMAMSWFIEVYKAAKKTILLCPECYKDR